MKIIQTLALAGIVAIASAGESGTNLVKNPDFKSPAGYMGNWKFASMGDDIFTLKYDKEKQAVSLASSSNEFSGYLTQDIPVTPGKEYVARCNQLLPLGRALLWAAAMDANKQLSGKSWTARSYSFADNPLFPEFIRPEYAPGGGRTEWKDVEVRFTPDEKVHFIRLSVGSYFGQGIVYFRKVELYENPRTANGGTMNRK